LAFTHSINIMNLMASSEVLQEVDRLIKNYEEESGSEKQQWEIVNRIIYMMRRDLLHSRLDELKDYRFPFIVPDLPEADDNRPRARGRRRQ